MKKQYALTYHSTGDGHELEPPAKDLFEVPANHKAEPWAPVEMTAFQTLRGSGIAILWERRIGWTF